MAVTCVAARWSQAILAVVVLVAALGVVTADQEPAAAYPGAPWFQPDRPYDENFPDPSVVRDGDTYHAYATTTGGSYLPVMASTDLAGWTARSAYPQPACVDQPPDPLFNDALPCPAAWAPDRPVGGRLTKAVQAPGVARIGDGWVVYYAVLTDIAADRWCLSVATADSPLGPFIDRSTGPLVCDADPKGSRDPQPFVDADGTPYLIWKSEGHPCNPICAPTRLWSRRLAPDGTGFAPGSAPRELLATTGGWEGRVIENPSMVRHDGRLYLFYSANEWVSADYATGYAECASPVGPCTKRTTSAPLLASEGSVLGPGGAAAFTDADGQLHLAYHHWTAPHVGYPQDPGCDRRNPPLCTSQGQRRMRIEPVYPSGQGLRVGGPPPVTAPVRAIDAACPPGAVPEDGFADVADRTTHERAVDCIVWWDITRGTGAGYDPAGLVTRGQMASFIARLVDVSGGTLPPSTDDRFRDDGESVHRDNIDRLAAADVIGGFADGTYRPGQAVSRDQMAAFLVRAHDLVAGSELDAPVDYFADDSASVHRGSIDQAAHAGIAGGYGDGTYRPRVEVRRDQMASFLGRLLDLFVSVGASTPPR